MKKIFLFFASLTLLAGCASKTNFKPQNELVCIQIVDRNGMNETISSKERLEKYEKTNFLSSQPYKQVVRIYDNKTTQKSSVITTYHPNGFIHQYLEVANARAFGKYRQWHQNGVQEIEASVIGGPAGISEIEQREWIFDKQNYVWDDLGRLISTFNYDKGQLEGNAYHYHINGNIKMIEPYHNNEIHGPVVGYNEEGTIILKGEYKEGKRKGLFEGFWDKDIPSLVENYDNDLLLDGKYFNMDRSLTSEIKNGYGIKTLFFDEAQKILVEYQNGVPQGSIDIYKNSKIQSHYNVKDGKKHGEEMEYYSDGKTPKLSLNWFDDKIHGTVKTWYGNGNIQSQREMYENKKNGICTAWYLNGNIMLIEEYENDSLVKASYFKPNESIPVSTIYGGNGKATIFDENGNFLRSIIYQNGYPQVE